MFKCVCVMLARIKRSVPVHSPANVSLTYNTLIDAHRNTQSEKSVSATCCGLCFICIMCVSAYGNTLMLFRVCF